MNSNYDKVSILLPMNGENNESSFFDWSSLCHKPSSAGGIVTSTSQSKYYGSSGYFDGDDSYISIPNDNSFWLKNSDFCIGAWVRFAGYGTQLDGAMHICSQDVNGNRSWYFSVEGTFQSIDYVTFAGYSNLGRHGLDVFFAQDLDLNKWYFFSVARASNLLFFGLDGVILNSPGNSYNHLIQDGATPLIVGAHNFGLTNLDQRMNGFINDFFIAKGVSSCFGINFTANFTPPVRRLGVISNEALGAEKILDSDGNPAVRTIFAVPRIAPTRAWSSASDSLGDFEIHAPSAVEHSVVALADESDLYNDLVHRVIPV
jgi:hypothetical protein